MPVKYRHWNCSRTLVWCKIIIRWFSLIIFFLRTVHIMQKLRLSRWTVLQPRCSRWPCCFANLLTWTPYEKQKVLHQRPLLCVNCSPVCSCIDSCKSLYQSYTVIPEVWHSFIYLDNCSWISWLKSCHVCELRRSRSSGAQQRRWRSSSLQLLQRETSSRWTCRKTWSWWVTVQLLCQSWP